MYENDYTSEGYTYDGTNSCAEATEAGLVSDIEAWLTDLGYTAETQRNNDIHWYDAEWLMEY